MYMANEPQNTENITMDTTEPQQPTEQSISESVGPEVPTPPDAMPEPTPMKPWNQTKKKKRRRKSGKKWRTYKCICRTRRRKRARK